MEKRINILEVFCDGACHNDAENGHNHMGIGVHINFEGEEYWSYSGYAGLGTSNKAEYIALRKAIIEGNWMATLFKKEGIKIDKILIHSDSMLVVMQYNRRWQCKEKSLKKYLKR